MAFTTKHISGVLGEFKPVLDIAGGTFTTKQVSGVLGEFKPVLDIAQVPAGGGTNMQINIGDVWKDVSAIQINIGDVWKDVTKAQINIGDVWKTIFEP